MARRFTPAGVLLLRDADDLVERTTQADPIVDAWERAAGSTRAWYDLPPTGDHSPDFLLNLTMFKLWLGHVRDRSW